MRVVEIVVELEAVAEYAVHAGVTVEDDAAEEQSRIARFVAEQSRSGIEKPASARSGAIFDSEPTVSASLVPPPPDTREIRPGIFLRTTGDQSNPTLELSGPSLDATLCARLEAWLATGI